MPSAVYGTGHSNLAVKAGGIGVDADGMRRMQWVVLGIFGAAVAWALAVRPAGAAAGCTYDADTRTVTVQTDPTALNVVAGDTTAITVDDIPCGAATSTNTDRITINGTGGADVVTVGYITPGRFNVNAYLDHGEDSLVIEGTPGADWVRSRGSNSLNREQLGSAERTQIDWSGVENLEVRAFAGYDRIDLGQVTADVTVDGGPGYNMIVGGFGEDVLVGGPDGNWFDSAAHSDGDDEIVGGAGVDTVDYSYRNIPVSVRLGASGSSGGDDESDTLLSIEGAIGSWADDVIIGSAVSNEIDGGAGNDTIFAGRGDDVLRASAGDDTVDPGAGDDIVNGGAGADLVVASATYDGDDQIEGGSGEDVISYSLRQNDLVFDRDVYRGSGAPSAGEEDGIFFDVEEIIGGSGDDLFTFDGYDGYRGRHSGGPGIDTASVATFPVGITIETGEVSAPFGIDTDIEVIVGTPFADTFIESDAYRGSQHYIGGGGSDTVDFSQRTDYVTLSWNGRTHDGDVLTDIRTLRAPRRGSYITAGTGPMTVMGNVGPDTFRSGPGDDTFYGDAGNDTFVAASNDGNDFFRGGAGADTVYYSHRTSPVHVDMRTAEAGAAGEHDRIPYVEHVLGGQGDDVIIGDEEANHLDGHGGNDVVFGLDGNDVLTGRFLRGGTGNDLLRGTLGDDVFWMDRADGNDIVVGGYGLDTVNYEIRSAPLRITLTRVDDDDGAAGESDRIRDDIERVIGGSGDDVLIGNAFANELFGGRGDDVLDGRDGNDTLDCGSGERDLGIRRQRADTITGCERVRNALRTVRRF